MWPRNPKVIDLLSRVDQFRSATLQSCCPASRFPNIATCLQRLRKLGCKLCLRCQRLWRTPSRCRCLHPKKKNTKRAKKSFLRRRPKLPRRNQPAKDTPKNTRKSGRKLSTFRLSSLRKLSLPWRRGRRFSRSSSPVLLLHFSLSRRLSMELSRLPLSRTVGLRGAKKLQPEPNRRYSGIRKLRRKRLKAARLSTRRWKTTRWNFIPCPRTSRRCAKLLATSSLSWKRRR